VVANKEGIKYYKQQNEAFVKQLSFHIKR